MADNEKRRQLASSAEEQRISRTMTVWVNTYPDWPEPISQVNFEHLPADRPGITLSVQNGARIISRYILGGHLAEYSFAIIYRIKPGASIDARLTADEILNAFGDWAQENPPELEEVRLQKLEVTERAGIVAAYEDGDEDHQILLTLTYEVI